MTVGLKNHNFHVSYENAILQHFLFLSVNTALFNQRTDAWRRRFTHFTCIPSLSTFSFDVLIPALLSATIENPTIFAVYNFFCICLNIFHLTFSGTPVVCLSSLFLFGSIHLFSIPTGGLPPTPSWAPTIGGPSSTGRRWCWTEANNTPDPCTYPRPRQYQRPGHRCAPRDDRTTADPTPGFPPFPSMSTLDRLCFADSLCVEWGCATSSLSPLCFSHE